MAGSAEQHGRAAAGAKKRILIDASPVTSTVDGLSVYIVNLIRNLPADALAEFDFTILLNPGIDWPELAEAMRAGGMEELRVGIAPIGPHRDWDMFRFLRRHRSRFDLIHITSHNYPIALKGGIVTIHDVTFKTWFDSKSRLPGWRFGARFYLDRIVRRALRRADAVIAVSDSTRRELIDRFAPSDPGKIRIVHEGWEHLADYDPDRCEPFDFDAGGYLFFLGSYRVHKNLSLLLEAFRLAMDRIPEDRILVISGSSGRLSAANRGVLAAINAKRERVKFTGYVSNHCVARLYREADAFIFPSLSEGFGLPVLEAFHFGAPVLASRATSLPEVAGEAALYFDPHDARNMADAIVRFYAERDLGPRLAAAGTERLGRFSWKKAAEETVALYRECLSSAR